MEFKLTKKEKNSQFRLSKLLREVLIKHKKKLTKLKKILLTLSEMKLLKLKKNWMLLA
jgi:hypothetical protein